MNLSIDRRVARVRIFLAALAFCSVAAWASSKPPVTRADSPPANRVEARTSSSLQSLVQEDGWRGPIGSLL